MKLETRFKIEQKIKRRLYKSGDRPVRKNREESAQETKLKKAESSRNNTIRKI